MVHRMNLISSGGVFSAFLNMIYPVGSVYINVNDVNPSTFLGGTWESVGSGRVLQGADSTHLGGTTIEAGLPNIEGKATIITLWNQENKSLKTTTLSSGFGCGQISSGSRGELSINASNSNSIYGNSDTVQPPAYCVYMYKRIA